MFTVRERILGATLIVLLAICIVTACGGNPGRNGKDGSSCSVTDTEGGALISCDDGSEVEILNGEVDDNDQDVIIIVCKKHKHGPKVCLRKN